MSWDMWVTCFHKGELGRFPREIVERAFDGFTDRTEADYWRLHGCHGTVSLGVEREIDSFAVNRPPGPDHPFWPALIKVLKQTSCVLYWPGDGSVVANKSVIHHIPATFDKAVGTPTVTTDLDEIMEMIRKA